ncbi:hypothetical protein PCO87_05520 [Pectobacteriaceae bacterium C52]|nr:hypothetical protein PCO87_05520 [Pectobacteriaceae bacterium C52]
MLDLNSQLNGIPLITDAEEIVQKRGRKRIQNTEKSISNGLNRPVEIKSH